MEYMSLDQKERYELWEGQYAVREPGSTEHEAVNGNLFCIIAAHVRQHRLGRVYLSNTGVHLKGKSSADFVMPDISFVSEARKNIVDSRGIWGAPDLAVEIVSPGIRNTKRDTVDKFRWYEQYGVREYWLVDYVEREIYIYSLQGGKFVQVDESVVFSGILLPKDEIFDVE